MKREYDFSKAGRGKFLRKGAKCRLPIILGASELVKEKRSEIIKIAAEHGAFNVRIFGSVARGESNSKSDIDFLVEVGQNHSSFFPGGLLADLEDLLGRKVDVVTPNSLHWFIREKVLREAIPL